MSKNINNKKKELIYSLGPKDFRVDTFRSGGKGGQHQNRTESGVRIVHIESGAVGECREHRSQYQNKKEAFMRLVNSPKFQAWHKRKVAMILLEKEQEKSIEEQVDEAMKPENLRIEYKVDGVWVDEKKIDPSQLT